MKQHATFYHAGCPVCVDAEQSLAASLDPARFDVEIVHLGESPGRVIEAEQAGADRFGSAELSLARDKLRAAEDAADDGAAERAQRLAVEADLDADLAAAITRNQQTQALVSEVESTLRTLEDELRRSSGASERR